MLFHKWFPNFRRGYMKTSDIQRSIQLVDTTYVEIINKICDLVMDDRRMMGRKTASAGVSRVNQYILYDFNI